MWPFKKREHLSSCMRKLVQADIKHMAFSQKFHPEAVIEHPDGGVTFIANGLSFTISGSAIIKWVRNNDFQLLNDAVHDGVAAVSLNPILHPPQLMAI